MAYMNQEIKKRLAPKIKEILKKYEIKATLSVRHHITLCLTIQSGKLGFRENYYEVGKGRKICDCFIDPDYKPVVIQTNPYYLDSEFSGECLKCLQELNEAMNDGNWDKSDIQTDYFNVGWHIDINIGTYDKPYTVK